MSTELIGTSTQTGGDVVAQSLLAAGIDCVFGLPGIQLDPLFDAFARRREEIELIHTRHEQAAAYMADGYARASGRIGCCVVVPGPGLLNAAAGLATAYSASSPVLCVTGQIYSKWIDAGLGLLHEIPDQLQVARAVTKWAARPSSAAEIAAVLDEAIARVTSGRPRPVAVEIPPDFLAENVEKANRPQLASAQAEADPADLDRAAGLLRAAKRPLIAAGGGAVQSGAWNEVASLARLLRAPVLMTPESKGIISARDPLAFEWMAAPDLIPAADVVLAVGTRYANPSTKRRPVPLGQSFIRIDADPFEIQLVPSTAVAIAGDARRCLGGLLAALGSTESSASAWDQQQLVAIREKCAAIVASIHPQAEFGAALREELPDDAVVIHGMTQLGYWARYGFPVYEPRTFIGPGYMGALGFEVATGLGAQAADRDRKVVVIAGDGGFMFNVQELATAVQHQLNAILVVFNDSAFGNVRRIQQVSYGARYIATDLRNPDFVKLAEAFGVRGIKADGPQGLRLALRQALSLSGPVLIEVPVGQMDDLRRINPKT